MDYIICYDVGTSGIKCGLFDENLSCCAITQSNYTVTMNADSTAEANPDDYFAGVAKCTRDMLAKSRVLPENIRSLCITTQGETLIPVDQAGAPLMPAVVWLDGRAEKEAAWIKQRIPDDVFRAKTGLPGIDRYVPLAKLLHIKNEHPDVYLKTNKFLLLEDYLTYRLTDKQVSEKSLLSSTGYFELPADTIWQEALDLIGVEREKIPTMIDPGMAIGNLTATAAGALGLSQNTVVYAGAMDQVAGAVGCGNYIVGAAHEATGTAMVAAATLPLDSCLASDPQLTIYRHVQPDEFLLLAISRTATVVLKWFAEQFYGNNKREDIYDYLSSVAEKACVGANGMLMLPYYEGLPGNDDVKGAFLNVGLHNTREDFVRAVFEGIAYMLNDNIRLMFGNQKVESLVSIGGASKSEIWCQIKADITGSTILTIGQQEAALFGCACIAAVGSGAFASLTDAVNTQKNGKVYKPNKVNEQYYENRYSQYCAIKETVAALDLRSKKTK